MTQTHYTQIVRTPPSYLDATGYVTDNVPVFDGVTLSPQFPIAAFNANTSLGRVAEINITGAGGLATVLGKRLTINIDKGLNARSVYPSVGVYQSITNLDVGVGITTSFASGTLAIAAAPATTSSIGAMPAYPLSNPTFVFLRGDGLWAVPPSSGGGGGGTMNGWRSQLVNQFGAVQSSVNITDNFVQQFQSGTGIDIQHVDLGGGSRVTIGLAAGGGYIHPTYTAFNFMPSLVGNTLTIPAITTDTIGSTASITAQSFTLPTGGSYTHPAYSPQTFTPTLVGTTLTVAGFSRDAIGSLDTITPFSFTLPSSGGGAVSSVSSGNPTVLTVSPTTGAVVVTPIGQSTTLNSAWNSSTRILSIPVGVYQGGILTSSFLNQFDLTPAVSTSTVEVRFNDVTVNPAAYIINFKGAGVQSVTNGIGVEITIPGASGGGGISGVSINGVGTYANIIVDGAGVSVVGNHITISGGGGGGVLGGTSGNGLIVNPNSVSLNLASIFSAGAMPVLPNNANVFLNGVGAWATPPSVSAGVSSFNLATGAINLVNGTNTTVVDLGGGSFKINVPTMGGSGGISSVVTNSTRLSGFVSGGGTILNLNLNGITQSDTNSWNPTTRLLTVTEYLTEQGNVWGTVQRGFTIDSGLPTALPGFTLYGTAAGTWNATANILVANDQWTALRSDSSSNRAAITLDGLSKRAFMSVGTNAAIIDMYTNSIRLKSQQQGFFDAVPINKPNVITGDHASTQAALQALGLINLV